MLRHVLCADANGGASVSIWLLDSILSRPLNPMPDAQSTGPFVDLKGAFSSILEGPVIFL